MSAPTRLGPHVEAPRQAQAQAVQFPSSHHGWVDFREMASMLDTYKQNINITIKMHNLYKSYEHNRQIAAAAPLNVTTSVLKGSISANSLSKTLWHAIVSALPFVSSITTFPNQFFP
jgi:hypothetical protein